ncbi:Fic family protein [Planctomycetota bacterium]
MADNVVFHWRPIEDLPKDWRGLASSEMQGLAQVWQEQRQELEENESLREFNEQLIREWAIETGIIEQMYTLSRGVTQLLIEKGIDSSLIAHDCSDQNPELVVAMIRDHQAAAEGLFQFVKGDRELSVSYIKELHAVLTRHQTHAKGIDSHGRAIHVELQRGQFKSLPNNPTRSNGGVHKYCPPEQASSEMDRLVELYLVHREQGVPPEIESAWLHHRFTQIHPFQDGNGRVARCLATLVFLREGFLPLVVRNVQRELYIRSLERADGGDLSALVALFVEIQRKSFVEALGVARDVGRRQYVSQVIDAVGDDLLRKQHVLQERWGKAKDMAADLQGLGRSRLEEIDQELQRKIGTFEIEYKGYVDDELFGSDRCRYFKFQIGETATALGYYANLRDYSAWSRLVMRVDDSQAEILVSYHTVGFEFRGVVGVSACYYTKGETDEQGSRDIVDLTPLSEQLFQVNYAEDMRPVKKRFSDWLESALVSGLEIWRRSL